MPGISNIWRNPPRVATGWRPEDWGLFGLFIAALIAASPIGQVVALIAMISFIGIPIAIILAAIPGLFAIALLLRLCLQTWRVWRAGSFSGIALFGVLTIVLADLMIFGAWRENNRLDRMASAMMARDQDSLPASPAKPQTLAIVRNGRAANDKDTLCDDLCMRLLLKDGAKRVLAIALVPPAPAPAQGAAKRPKRPNSTSPDTDWPALDWREDTQGTLYWLEKRSRCEEPKIGENLRTLSLRAPESGKGATMTRAIRADEAMRLKVASGLCLMSRPATLAEADAAFAYGTIKSGLGEYAAAQLTSADTLSAWQSAYATRRGSQLQDQYRATGILAYRFPWLRIPTYVSGYQFALTTGWLRVSHMAGARTRYQDKPDVEGFFTDRLGVNLRLEEGQGPAGGGEAVSRILASSGALGDNDRKILRDFVSYAGSLALGRTARLSAEDAGRIVQIAADQRVTLEWQFGGAAAAAARDLPERGVELARLLFARFSALPDNPAEGQELYRWREQAGALAGALARLPDEHLRPFRSDMQRIARTPLKRDRAAVLLRRLDLFGPDIAPFLLQVMQASVADARAERGTKNGRVESGSAGYTGALAALCKLGPQAAGSLAALIVELQTPDNPLLRRNADGAVISLVRLGAGEDLARAVMEVDGGDEKAVRLFDTAMRRAKSNNPCS